MMPARGQMGVLLAPLRTRGYQLLWTGNLVSLIGDQFQVIALALLMLELPRGVAGLGSVLMVQALPRLLLSLISGVAIDRLRARSVLLASNLLQGGVVAALFALTVLGRPSSWQLYLYALVSGVALAFSHPASNTLIPELLPSTEVRSANALSVSTFNLTRFLVPPLAAWVIAKAGISAAFALNAASFLVAAWFLWLLPEAPRPPSIHSPPDRLHWWHELKEGLRVAREDTVIWCALVMSAVYSFGYYGTAFVSLPALARLTLHAGEEGVGLLYGALGAGALVGAVVTGGVARLRRPGLIGGLVIAGNGTALVLAGLAPSLGAAVPLLVVSGACGAASAVIFFSLVQTRARPSVRGRIVALNSLAIVGMYPLSFGLAGLVGEVLGPRTTVVCGGLSVALAGLLGLSRRVIRQVDTT